MTFGRRVMAIANPAWIAIAAVCMILGIAPFARADALPPAAVLDNIAGVWRVQLTATHVEVSRGDGKMVHGWTYDGVIPGPLIVVPQDAIVDVTMNNGDPMTDMTHGLDIHAAQISPVAFTPVPRAKSLNYRFTASVPGAYLYHCSGQPMLQHLANGMFGAFIVVPKNATPARSYVIIQNEWYGEDDLAAMSAGRASAVTFNGSMGALVRHPLLARTGETVRFYLVDAGPSHSLAFHVIGALIHPYGVSSTELLQTYEVPPGSGSIVEVRFAHPGRYMLLSHDLGSAYLGAMGYIDVTEDVSQTTDTSPVLQR
jgi:nitrite reductase (NO-forming)